MLLYLAIIISLRSLGILRTAIAALFILFLPDLSEVLSLTLLTSVSFYTIASLLITEDRLDRLPVVLGLMSLFTLSTVGLLLPEVSWRELFISGAFPFLLLFVFRIIKAPMPPLWKLSPSWRVTVFILFVCSLSIIKFGGSL